jgi:pimeloyl-ACP methyl ester carboxylesterase
MTSRLSRRALAGLPAAMVAGATVASEPARAQTPGPQRTFVLVHGAWHGGWCWRRVSDALLQRGHRVFAPTLTGLGERSHLLSTDVDLKTHIDDIVNLFRFEDVADAVLVAHSYGGWPVSGALEEIHGQVASVVFLDAFMPQNGQRGIDTQSPASAAAVKEAFARGEAGRKGPSAAAFNVRPENQAWVDAKITAQPIGVSLTPIALSGARDRIAKKAYVRATAYPQPTFDQHLAECKAAGWRTYELPVGHDVMVDAPDRLVDILLEVA